MTYIARLISVLFLMLIASIAVRAEEEIPQACTGRDLYKQLAETDPAAYARIETLRKTVPNQGPLLWKVDAPNGASPSYVFGTAHVTDTRIAVVPESVREKVRISKVLLLELREVVSEGGIAGAVAKNPEFTQLPKGKKLWDLIPDNQEDKVRFHPNLALIPAPAMETFKPWVLAAMLSEPICEIIRKPHKFVLDQALGQVAQYASVPIEGLETVEEQMAVFGGMSLEEQAQALMDGVAHGIPAEDSFHTLKELYLTRKVSAMVPLMEHLVGQKGIVIKQRDLDFMTALIDKRNVNMADRAAAYIDKGGAFIAVGALHLPGKVGVVELLKKKGYKLTPAE